MLARLLDQRLGASKAQYPERRPTVAAAVHEVSPIWRDGRLLKKQPGLRKVGQLLYGPAVGRHAVNVQVVWLKIEPTPVRRVEHVADAVVTSRQELGLTPTRRDSPELARPVRIRSVHKPATVRRPDDAEFVIVENVSCLARRVLRSNSND